MRERRPEQLLALEHAPAFVPDRSKELVDRKDEPGDYTFRSEVLGIDGDLAQEMTDIATGIEEAIDKLAIVDHPEFGRMYAYEIDGFGSFNLMVIFFAFLSSICELMFTDTLQDDANIPSLLSIPHLRFKNNTDEVYRNTRDFVLSKSNPYYAYGPVINAPGGPHQGPGMGWPMGIIMQLLTSDDDDEITGGLKVLMGSTSGLGLMHETVNSHNESSWTRPW
jgi:meiotically up-regulated gene 157 (Mug157) protein